MMSAPETLYATTHDGVSIAYQIVGDGPVDLVLELSDWGNVESYGRSMPLPTSSSRLFAVLAAHPPRPASDGLSGGGRSPTSRHGRGSLGGARCHPVPPCRLVRRAHDGRRLRDLRGAYPNRARFARMEPGGRDEAVVARVPVGPRRRTRSRGGPHRRGTGVGTRKLAHEWLKRGWHRASLATNASRRSSPGLIDTSWPRRRLRNGSRSRARPM